MRYEGQVASVQLPNGMLARTAYPSLHRPSAVGYTLNDQEQTWLNDYYGYDERGRINKSLFPGLGGGRRYTFDSFSQLAGATDFVNHSGDCEPVYENSSGRRHLHQSADRLGLRRRRSSRPP